MKKEDITSLVIYMLIVAVAIVYSFTVLRTHFEMSTYSSGFIYALVILGAVAVGIASTAILMELGHIVGAKIGGYNIVSVCVLFFTFFKEENKWKFKFASFDGLTGETKIVPKNEKSSPKAHHWFGTLFLILWAIGCFAIYLVLVMGDKHSVDIAYFFQTVMVVVLICLVYNILPLKLDTKTDGYALRMMLSNNKTTYNKMLSVDKQINDGNEDLEVETIKDITNYTADVNLNKVNILIDKKDYKQANDILDLILNNKDRISYKIFIKTLSVKIFVFAMIASNDEITKYLNDTVDMETRRYLSEDNSLNAVRAYILLESLTDLSKSECVRVIGKVNNLFKKVNKNRMLSEASMYNDTIDYVIKLHPKWEFEKYKIDLSSIK